MHKSSYYAMGGGERSTAGQYVHGDVSREVDMTIWKQELGQLLLPPRKGGPGVMWPRDLASCDQKSPAVF